MAAEATPKATPSNAAVKEIERRQQSIQTAQKEIQTAEEEYLTEQYDAAAQRYLRALQLIPDSSANQELRQIAKLGYSRAALKQAAELVEQAQFQQARVIVLNILSKEIDPNSKEAQALLDELNDPTRYEPALTPEHVANVEQVAKLIRLADSYSNIGDYDKALKTYQEVLRIDRYNSAARRGMERVEQNKARYYSSARDHVRAKKLAEVDALWEAPVTRTDVSGLFGAVIPTGGESRRDGIMAKLNAIQLPRVDLQNTTLEELVEFLKIRSRELDPDKKGIDFVVRVSTAVLTTPISLSLTNVPLQEVLRYATQSTGTDYAVDDYAVTITSLSDVGNTMISKSYRVPPDFIQSAPIDNNPTPGSVDPFGSNTASSGIRVRRVGAKEFLEQRGINFPEGSTASYTPASGMLFVRNTASNINMIDNLVEASLTSVPKQVEITVKMIEVNETKLNELGFDWLMSPFNIPGSSRLYGSGGSQTGMTAQDVAAIWADGTPIGDHSLTSGLRGAPALEATQSIDSLLNGVNGVGQYARTPGTFAVTGVFSDPQFQLIIRSLNQQKGVDIMASPSIVARSGQRANVTISREFPYPTDFDPPEIPQQFDPGNGATPITPTTPTTFEKRDVGIVLDVEPLISSDNTTVEVSLTPASTEFEGFIDYGTDIVGSTMGVLGPQFYNIQNDILQPVFHSKKINTSVTVYDGATIVLGGMMQERISNINDKVPFLGDLPFIGRGFQSKARKSEKKNVLFFVTVKIIDPAGRRINQPAEPEPTELTAPLAPSTMYPIVETSK